MIKLKPKIQRLKLRRGITLIEVVVAAAVFAFFIGSVMAAVIADAHNGPINERRLQAASLAREGIELATQIRDTMWITGQTTWSPPPTDQVARCYGLNAGTNKKLVKKTGPVNICNFSHWSLENNGPESINVFTREITVDDLSSTDKKLITVTVWWLEGGERTEIVLKKIITNWKAI